MEMAAAEGAVVADACKGMVTVVVGDVLNAPNAQMVVWEGPVWEEEGLLAGDGSSVLDVLTAAVEVEEETSDASKVLVVAKDAQNRPRPHPQKH